jgi:hypothetical protein
MATERLGENESYVAGADLRTHQYKLVKLTATDTVGLATAATDLLVGVLKNKPNTGEWASVAQQGISKVLSDGSGTAIVAGDPLTCDASSRVIKAVTNNHVVIGFATEPSSAANIVIGVDLSRPTVYLGA